MARRLAADIEILGDGEGGENAAVFRHEADAAPRDLERTQPRNIFTAEAHRPAAPRQQRHQRLQGGGLAGAVAAHQRDHFAAADLKREVEQDARRAVPGVEAFDLQHGVGYVCAAAASWPALAKVLPVPR